MILAIINGLITSILLETVILVRQNFSISNALKTASGMSLISMLSMEIMMNLTDYFLTGGAILTLWVIPIMLIVGFLTPWPYNYWRLKKFGINCH
jgi:LytS/YehU family sensor histidine kinase